MYAKTYGVHNVHNSTVAGRGGRGVVYVVCRINVLVFSNFNIQKGVEVIIGLKLKIRIMSSVTMFNTILFTKGVY